MARVLLQVRFLTSMSLGFSIYKIGITSKNNLTELTQGLNDLMCVKSLTEIKAQKKNLNRNYYYFHSK